ncbi:uncharacterized protein EDB93DRAFT_1101904 [Suillus bovinus]|uniref:uncharacterized protein n=1 Tax=Suillus bovinus TaxID=48563 RepID=UPI001B867FFD|nr:uncharacterized protein EDB93DRAFT_1101904 [Suillus bovinus]KAG2155344.1 hypothetical protein EDB93DRAFT_1101904 [Suillus bovinus]
MVILGDTAIRTAAIRSDSDFVVFRTVKHKRNAVVITREFSTLVLVCKPPPPPLAHGLPLGSSRAIIVPDSTGIAADIIIMPHCSAVLRAWRMILVTSGRYSQVPPSFASGKQQISVTSRKFNALPFKTYFPVEQTWYQSHQSSDINSGPAAFGIVTRDYCKRRSVPELILVLQPDVNYAALISEMQTLLDTEVFVTHRHSLSMPASDWWARVLGLMALESKK